MNVRFTFRYQAIQYLLALIISLTIFSGSNSIGQELNHQFTTQSTTRRLIPNTAFYGKRSAERIGYYLAGAGDVNADGFGDFMVAAYHHDSHGWNCGGVYLFLGARGIRWGAEESILECDAIFKGSHAYETVGYNVAGKGDFNGDGFDDLLIGAPANWETDPPEPGTLYIVLGKANPDWGKDFILIDRADISYLGQTDLDQLGYATDYVGDLDGDGCDDVLCAAPFRNEGGNKWTGKVYLFLGKKSGFERNLDGLKEAAATFIYPSDEGKLGYSVAGVGDVNADGHPDFVIGAEGIGTAFLLLGKPAVDWGIDFHLENADVIFTPEHPQDHAGWQVKAVGDVNADGFDDFALTGVQMHSCPGKIYLILGRKKWDARTISLSQSDASFEGEGFQSDAGMSLDAVGDFDGDGIDDFIVGSRYYTHRQWYHSGKY